MLPNFHWLWSISWKCLKGFIYKITLWWKRAMSLKCWLSSGMGEARIFIFVPCNSLYQHQFWYIYINHSYVSVDFWWPKFEGRTWNTLRNCDLHIKYCKYSKNLWTFWLFNSHFLKFWRKYALFRSHLAKVRPFCEIWGILCRHFLKCSVSKMAATGSSFFTVSCVIRGYHYYREVWSPNDDIS